MSGTQMQLEDWLDDLCVRFIINLPQEDLSSVARICFQVEEAQWFYEDFIRPLDPTLPSMTLRTFCLRIFQHCPLLANFSVENHTKAFEEFLEYKTRVPVRGAIMLNEAMDSTVLVKGWKKGANWSFPRGKINKDEDDLDCAIREVYEETGLDLRAAGLVPTEHKPKYIEISMREQHMRLYVFRDVPMDTVFEPKTRKEISKIQWYKLSELPAFRRKTGQSNDAIATPNANKFYMVAPFLVPLKKWVTSQKKMEARRAATGPHAYGPITEAPYEDEAWKTDTGAENTDQGPAIETLAGATQELQRLLKVQPPTQGLQGAPAPIQQDKGSALLSILQAKDGPSGGLPQPGVQYPHTPLDLTAQTAPQPHTPHHHNYPQLSSVSTQQPPPPFPYAPNQPAQWSVALGQPACNHPQYNDQYPMQEGQYKSNQAPLVHPQPLPPQVERAVFNRSVFQDVNQTNYNSVPGQFINQQQTQYGQTSQMPPQALNPNGQPRQQQQLNGQSMALLNAFKGGNGGLQSQHTPFSPGFPAQNQSSTYNNIGGNQAQQQVPLPSAPQTGAVAGSQERTGPSPKELPGSKVGPPADNHRSALLGMFRKDDQNPHPSRSPQITAQAAPGSMMSELMRSAGGDNARTPISSQVNTDTNLPVSLESLSLHSRPDQTGTPSSQGRMDFAQYSAQAHGPAASQSTQPIRILQRGQADQLLGVGGASASPQASFTSPSGLSAHLQLAGGGVSPSIAQAFPAQNRRRESGPAQKRELLSLFGKQPSPASLEAAKGKEAIAGTPRSRLASLASGVEDPAGPPSRRGSQTPISPAERTFLLDYLQSVTKNANH
ncbi:mRNA-decapping enzyme subunit 2 [Fusarium irregulare]|uniref:mRNA-decapping enzyme subunit 2 n=1 Tax=Fusarium irregulare TaxID=2494466 RepID=A0A9W8PUG9_9HYPO|nr:mRNA-decapping enzyme subunit 2 [Fusarium irregulare]KAJ4021704.1 mRNA-decapping enzyme subunit 2 [Fusarium irregulare]